MSSVTVLKHDIIYKLCLVKYNKSCLKCLKLSALFNIYLCIFSFSLRNKFTYLYIFLGILVPFLVGILTEGKTGLAPWHVVFYMTTGLLALEAVVFLLFGRGELQPWNNPKSRNISLNRK